MSQMTSLLAKAFAEGVDLGPRGHHIKAIAATLEKQVENLRQMVVEFGNKPEGKILNLDQLQSLVVQLNNNISNLAALAQNLNE